MCFFLTTTAALMERLPLPASYVMATATMVVPVSWTLRQTCLSVCEYPASHRAVKHLCANKQQLYYACVCIWGLSGMFNVLVAVITYSAFSCCFWNPKLCPPFCNLCVERWNYIVDA